MSEVAPEAAPLSDQPEADHLPPDDTAIATALGALVAGHALTGGQQALIRRLLVTVGSLAGEGASIGDLKIADAALAEMSEAFRVFGPYRQIRKATMFGSARTLPDDPVYVLARDLARRLADNEWMVVTGAGPGIMAAGTEGAGREHSFGVNIRLPHEQGANAFIAQDPKLVEMRYFFTRKLMLIKESDGYVVMPGGFGTLDECFELLTLLQTGKAEPAPVVLLDMPDGGFWTKWVTFIDDPVASGGFVSSEDRGLYKVVTTIDEAVDELLGFYSNYHSCRFVGDLLVIRLKELPDADALAELNRQFADIVTGGQIRPSDPLPPERAGDDNLDLQRLVLRFDRFHYGRLRHLIDQLNQRD